MSKRDYVMIAEAIRAELELCDDELQVWAVESLRDRLAQRMMEDNPLFSLNTFMDACEV